MPTFNLRHLRAFREVARYRNISEASGHVHLSQPAISQAIAKLEHLLDVRLFDRRSDGMFISEHGGLVLNRVDRALSFLEDGGRKSLQVAPRNRGQRIGKFDQLLTSAQLRALIAVSRTKNFSLAAQSVGMSQPSLHRAARSLELLSGIALFEKVNREIRLTPAGEVLVQHAKLAEAEMEQCLVEIEALKGIDAARIVIGSLPLARTFVLPHAINRLTERRPDVQVNVIDGPYDDLLHGLSHGEIDILIGALRDPVPIDDVEQEALFDDQLAIVVRAGHPLASKRHIDLADLVDYPWVVPRSGTPTRTHFEKLFPDKDKLPRLVESSSLILVRGLLLESDRVTIISAHQIHHECQQGLLAILPLDMSGTSRPIGLTLRKNWQPTASQEFFLEALRDASQAAMEML